MNAIITDQIRQNDSVMFEISCGKKSAHIWVRPNLVMVCCLNASHRAWGGLGKRFDSIEAAIAGYKSAEMKSILEAAAAELATA